MQGVQGGGGGGGGGVNNKDMDPITIAQALDNAAHGIAGSKPLDAADARAIQSAEARVTGIPTGVKGGLGATAQSLVDRGIPARVEDVIQNAKEQLPKGGKKIVTKEDAAYVQSAEERNAADGVAVRGGIAASVQSAADKNQQAGFTA